MTRPLHLRLVRDPRETAARDRARRHETFKAAMRAVAAAVLELHGEDAVAGGKIHDRLARLLTRALRGRG